MNSSIHLPCGDARCRIPADGHRKGSALLRSPASRSLPAEGLPVTGWLAEPPRATGSCAKPVDISLKVNVVEVQARELQTPADRRDRLPRQQRIPVRPKRKQQHGFFWHITQGRQSIGNLPRLGFRAEIFRRDWKRHQWIAAPLWNGRTSIGSPVIPASRRPTASAASRSAALMIEMPPRCSLPSA
jgi:hypothetical protein